MSIKTNTTKNQKQFYDENKLLSEFYDLYLTEIETIDEFWGPTFRAIYDGNDHEKFMQKLDLRIKHHDKEIEKLCSHYYEGFIEFVKELLEVRTKFVQLKEEVAGIEDGLQKSIKSVCNVKSELKQVRQRSYNIALVINALKQIQSVLLTYEKMKQLVRDRKFYSGLKILNQLQDHDLKYLPKYRFFSLMLSSFQKKKDNIKADALVELKDFLENIREISPRIGHIAVNQMSIQQKEIEVKTFQENDDEDVNATDLIDFSPVYRCLHIHTALDDKSSFIAYYQKQRWQQVKLTLKPPLNMNTVEEYQQYFFGILGFFMVEDHLLNTAADLVNKTYVDEMWKFVLSKMIAALKNPIAQCASHDVIIQIKDLVLMFGQCMEAYGYSAKELSAVLLDMQDHYIEILVQECTQVFARICNADYCQPIFAHNQKEYNEIISQFPFLQNEETISVSLQCLEEASEEGLKDYMNSSLSTYQDLRNETEQQIYRCLRDKVDEFVKISLYNWLLHEPSGQCSPYIAELIDFLQETFKSFEDLPDRVCQTACMCVCQQIAKRLLGFLLDEHIKQMSLGALQQVNLDVIQCEPSEPVAGFQEGSLQMCFLDLRQLLDLFMTWDWSTYFSDYGKENSKYLRVNPQYCIILLEKIREADKGKMLSVLKRSERDKKRLLDTVLKQLKQLVAST